MSKLNLLFFLNAYADAASTNNPSQNHFKWTRNLNGISVDNPIESSFSLAPGENRTVFDGMRTLLSDGTTQYSISLAPSTTNSYVLSWTGAGTAPVFRVKRNLGQDATTQVNVGLNGTVATFHSVAGTPLNTASLQIGDSVIIGPDFNVLNQGTFQVIAKSATGFSVVNASAAPETITLGAGYAADINAFGAAGVQPNDILVLGAGFSPVTQGSYTISAVTASTITFYSNAVLPQEGPLTAPAVTIYESAKRLVYIECDQPLALTVNGASAGQITPLIQNNKVIPGIYMVTNLAWTLILTNMGVNPVNVLVIAAE